MSGEHVSKKAQVHTRILVLWEILVKCEAVWTMSYRQKNAMSKNSSTISSEYNYWNKMGNLASITEQTSLIGLGKIAYM